MVSRLNSIELFAGCGGLLDGFKKSGKYNTLAAVEWQQYACDTLVQRLEHKYNDHMAKEKVLCFDIQRTDELISGWQDDEKFGSNNGLDELIGLSKIDVIAGGPPCQAYSVAGRVQDKDGMKFDYRNYLFESYLKIVEHYLPKIIVFENVEGMLSAKPDGTNILEKIIDGFNTAGYEIIDNIKHHALLDLSEFGIPQKRKRVIIVGLNRDYYGNHDECQKILNDFYDNILTSKKSDKKTVQDALYDLPKIYPLEEAISKKKSHINDSEINGHKSRYHSKRDIEIFKILAEDIESGENSYKSAEKLKELYTQMTGKTSNVHKYNVLNWDQQSNTIPAHLKKDGLRHIHPDSTQARTITVREAARLQTFDDDFQFTKGMGQNFEMIGNAVPPLFAEKLANSVYELYYKYTKIED